MKQIFRFFIIAFFGVLLWPFLLVKIINKKPDNKDLDNTIIIANHYSNFDPMLIKKLFLKRNLIFVADSDVKKKLWSRFLTWSFNCVYVSIDEVKPSAIKKCINILKNDGTVVIFPEGFVNPRKSGFLPFMKGYALIAKKSQANVLPLFLNPSGKIFRKNIIVFDKIYKYTDYSSYEDTTEINMFFLSKILDLSFQINT